MQDIFFWEAELRVNSERRVKCYEWCHVGLMKRNGEIVGRFVLSSAIWILAIVEIRSANRGFVLVIGGYTIACRFMGSIRVYVDGQHGAGVC